jgi:FkbM family methyltransferase
MRENIYIFDFLKKCGFDSSSIIFEIGSHMGFDTQEIRKILPDSKIYCFEPDPRNIKILKKRGIFNIANINTFAISDKDGDEYFNLSSGEIKEKTGNKYYDKNTWSASSSIRNPKNHLNIFPWCRFDKRILVETKKLDTFCSNNNIDHINFIWMDVQGCEDLVFKGGENILRNTEYIFTEYSNDELYEGQMNLNQLINFLPGEWIIRNDYGGDVLLENVTYRESMIKETGSWTIKNMNEHAFDLKLANFIRSLIDDFKINDCIDFGCGPGEYVKYFINNGISTRGYDGNINTPSISEGLCEVLDLTGEFVLDPSDLVLCLEVGEHIPEKYEDVFLKNIIDHVKSYLIISWGIPGQGGYGHVNCRDNSYIINKIENHGLKYMEDYSKSLRENSSMSWFNDTLMIFKK